MNEYGFMKVAAAVPQVRVADCRHNACRIEELIAQAADKEVDAVVFPELSVTGYTCGDLFAQTALLKAAEQAVREIVAETAGLAVTAIFGAPIAVGDRLFNCAIVAAGGKIIGIVPKINIPNYSEFYEMRWFASGGGIGRREISYAGERVDFGCDLLFDIRGVRCGVEICEDLWVPIPPSSVMAVNGASVIFNLSASPETAGKCTYRHTMAEQQSSRTLTAYVYTSAGWGESSTDLVFSGNVMIAECGNILASGERFSTDEQLVTADIDTELIANERRRRNTFIPEGFSREFTVKEIRFDHVPDHATLDRTVERHPFLLSESKDADEHCNEIFNIQTLGLMRRLSHTGCRSAVIGISGGLDSTLALLVTLEAFDRLGLDRKGIIGVTMPGFGTSDRTHGNAMTIMERSGITLREISIAKACRQHFADIGLDDSERGTAYENSQARERTQILMDIANMVGGIVVGTGDLSEAALGWATYNGDHMSMYNVNCSVPKTLVRRIVEYLAGRNKDEKIAAALRDIVETPVSPELLPADEKGEIAQITEDIVGPYELHDFFLFNMLRHGFAPSKIEFLAREAFGGKYSGEVIRHWLALFLRRFFAQQYKRSAVPDGPKAGSVSLSPRGDWRMPSDASVREWLENLER